MRVVPSYAVPVADLRVDLEAAPDGPPPEYKPVGFGDGPPLLDPSVPFAVHTAEARPCRSGSGTAPVRGSGPTTSTTT